MNHLKKNINVGESVNMGSPAVHALAVSMTVIELSSTDFRGHLIPTP
jgi:hypothetical protein